VCVAQLCYYGVKLPKIVLAYSISVHSFDVELENFADCQYVWISSHPCKAILTISTHMNAAKFQGVRLQTAGGINCIQMPRFTASCVFQVVQFH